jgi:hypothetical protein
VSSVETMVNVFARAGSRETRAWRPWFVDVPTTKHFPGNTSGSGYAPAQSLCSPSRHSRPHTNSSAGSAEGGGDPVEAIAANVDASRGRTSARRTLTTVYASASD